MCRPDAKHSPPLTIHGITRDIASEDKKTKMQSLFRSLSDDDECEYFLVSPILLLRQSLKHLTTISAAHASD